METLGAFFGKKLDVKGNAPKRDYYGPNVDRVAEHGEDPFYSPERVPFDSTAPLTEAQKREMRAVYDEYVTYDPNRIEIGWGYHQELQKPGSIWSKISPLEISKRAYDRIYRRLKNYDRVRVYNFLNNVANGEIINNMDDNGGTMNILRMIEKRDSNTGNFESYDEDIDMYDQSLYDELVVRPKLMGKRYFDSLPPPPGPGPNVKIEVGESELRDVRDIFTQDSFKTGERVIRLGERNNFIYKRDELERWWKKNPNTNPLVHGSREMPAGTKIERGILYINPKNGGRRRTKKMRSKRTTRRGTLHARHR
jgi:hypothetical protein